LQYLLRYRCRATSAATGKFKPFLNERSGSSYIDGALYYNCPAAVANQERKLLWPESSSQPPDILLSIGTGLPPEDQNLDKWRRLPGMFQPAVHRFDNMLDPQIAWDLFYQDVRDGDRMNLANERYVRFNPELRKKVEMDDVKAVSDLRNDVRAALRLPKWANDCSLVAKRLISSSFYFERDEDRFDQERIKGMDIFLFLRRQN
jgi:hypothetical protein